MVEFLVQGVKAVNALTVTSYHELVDVLSSAGQGVGVAEQGVGGARKGVGGAAQGVGGAGQGVSSLNVGTA